LEKGLLPAPAGAVELGFIDGECDVLATLGEEDDCVMEVLIAPTVAAALVALELRLSRRLDIVKFPPPPLGAVGAGAVQL
jgi:hypothetical protein